jgi:serine/alanine adding enzyme
MRVVNDLDRNVWRQFVEGNPRGNIFHTPEMYDVFLRTEGHHPSVWAVMEGDDRVLALLIPVEIILYRRLRRLSSRSVVYGGVLWEPSPHGHKGLSHLLAHYKEQVRNQNLFTEVRNLADTDGVQPIMRQSEFFYEDHLNYLIDLDRPPKEIMGGMRKRTRKHISSGIRKGDVTVQAIESRSCLPDCYALIERAYRRARIPVAPKSLFESAFDVLSSKGMVQFLLACVEDTPVATSVELMYKDVVYGWYSGMDRSYSSYTPNEMIMWHILRWGCEHGYRIYDFGGAGKPDEDYGVRRFKAKFGGELVNYGRNIFVGSRLFLRVSEFAYEAARRVFFVS